VTGSPGWACFSFCNSVQRVDLGGRTDVGGWVSMLMSVVLADRPIVRSSDCHRDFYRPSPFPQTNDYPAHLNILNTVGYGNWKTLQDKHWPRDMEKAGSPNHSVAPGRPASIIQPAKERKRKRAFTGVQWVYVVVSG